MYSRVHKSLESFFSKILEKPSIVQKKMIPHMNFCDEAKFFFFFFEKKKIQNGRLKKTSFCQKVNSKYFLGLMSDSLTAI